MTQSPTILNELKDLNSSLAVTGFSNPYTVPEGYFETFAEQVLNRIKAGEAGSAQEELAIISPTLAGLIRINPYEVPDGYFTGLADEALVLAQNSEPVSPVLDLTGKEMPYAVPAGYFENLEETLLAKVRQHPDYLSPQEELEELSPLLSGLKKEVPFEVPAGYFENLAAGKQVASPVVNMAPAKTVSFVRHKWVRFAAAAVVIGVLVLGGLKIFGSGTPKEERVVKNIVKELNKMDDAQLDELAEFTNAGLTTKETARVEPIKKSESQSLLKDVSDKELEQLDQFMDEVENEMNETSENLFE